ncbi:hypothetical protein WA026_016326 [Henosepilachna vigintioctopunctata]|uniref:Uncharacterized protein n=1 Tax=Henosepilachna vigintioctopunctata TaxID=420089 RepID=A0AAW1UL18_9CUCU
MQLKLPGSLSLTLMQCINIIVKNVTKPMDSINVFNMEVNYDFPTTRLDLTQTLPSKFDHTPKPQFYILGDLTQKQLDVTLYQFKDFQANLFNPWAKFMFLGSNFTRDFVGAVSRENIYNALFLNTVTGKIYTFFPYSGKRFISTPTLRIIGECDCDALNGNELFPAKYPDNWEGYELSVLMEKFELYTLCPDCEGPGIEIAILQLIANHLKMRSRFVFSNKILLDTFHKQNVYDALIGDRIVLPLRSFEQSVAYLHDHLRWFVPSPRKMYGWFDNFFANDTVFPQKFETTEDIAKYHLKVGSLTPIGEEYVFKSEGLEQYPRFLHVSIKQLETFFLETNIEEKEEIAILCLSRLGRHLTHKYLNRFTGLPYFKELRKPYFEDHSMAIFTKGNPVFLVVNRKLELLIESGIINKIIGKHGKYISASKNVNTIGKLNLKYTQVPLIILGIAGSQDLIVGVADFNRKISSSNIDTLPSNMVKEKVWCSED